MQLNLNQNSMKKILLTMTVIGMSLIHSYAQTSPAKNSGKFSIGLDAGLPIGSASDYSNFAIGGDLKYALPAATNFDVSLSAGYSAFLGKDGAPSLKAIPVKAGGRYNFSGGFFTEAQLGAAFVQDGGGTAFVYAPGIGYAFGGGLEAGVRYEGWSKNGTVSQVALRIAYSF